MVFTHRQYGRCVRPWSGDTSVLYQAAATRGQTRGLLSAAGAGGAARGVCSVARAPTIGTRKESHSRHTNSVCATKAEGLTSRYRDPRQA